MLPGSTGAPGVQWRRTGSFLRGIHSEIRIPSVHAQAHLSSSSSQRELIVRMTVTTVVVVSAGPFGFRSLRRNSFEVFLFPPIPFAMNGTGFASVLPEMQ